MDPAGQDAPAGERMLLSPADLSDKEAYGPPVRHAQSVLVAEALLLAVRVCKPHKLGCTSKLLMLTSSVCHVQRVFLAGFPVQEMAQVRSCCLSSVLAISGSQYAALATCRVSVLERLCLNKSSTCMHICFLS